jgi:hypothetical protein
MAKAVRITLSVAMVKALKSQLQIDLCTRCGVDLDEHRWIEVVKATREIVNCSNS